MRRFRLVLALCALMALVVGVPTASARNGGNSTNAKLCQKGGWQSLQTSSGQSFTSDGACTSYAAKGGTLTTPAPITQAQQDCNAIGGTYGMTDETNGGPVGMPVVWTCNGGSGGYAGTLALQADCPQTVGYAWNFLGTAGEPAFSCFG